MYRNAFEQLKAPTHYSTRDISRHIQLLLAEGESRDTTEPCRLALLSPQERLHEELLTLRGSDYDKEHDSRLQQLLVHVSKKLTGTEIVPFSQFIASEWIEELDRICPGNEQPAKTQVKKIVSAAQNPWLIQGVAALCTRAAIMAEREEPSHAVATWQEAMNWWQIFFASAKPEESFTYGVLTDEKARHLCVEAWKKFRSKLVHDIYTRCTTDYVVQNDGLAINACLNVLNTSMIRLEEPNIYEQTVAAIEPFIVAALMKSSNLNEAFNLWEGLPEFFKTKAAIISKLFSAMSAGVDNLESGRGDFQLLLKAWEQLDGEGLKQSSDIEIQAAMQKYYEAVSAFARNVLSEGENLDKKTKMEKVQVLLLQLPVDYTVGTDETNQKITPGMLLAQMAIQGIDSCNKKDARKNGAMLWNKIVMATSDKNTQEPLRKGLATAVLLKLQERGDDDFSREYLTDFPKNQPINSDDMRTIQDYLNNLGRGKMADNIVHLLQKFAECDVKDANSAELLQQVIRAVMEFGFNEDLNKQYEMLLKGQLVSCVNDYVTSGSSAAQALGLEIIDALPNGTTLPGPEGPIPLDMIRVMLGTPSSTFTKISRYTSKYTMRKTVFFLLFELFAILPSFIFLKTGALPAVTSLHFIVITAIAYLGAALITRLKQGDTMLADRKRGVVETSWMPRAFKHPLLVFVIMMIGPVVFFFANH